MFSVNLNDHEYRVVFEHSADGTACKVYRRRAGAEPVLAAAGSSVRHAGDAPDKRLGCKLSMTRALKALSLDKAQRGAFWEAYFAKRGGTRPHDRRMKIIGMLSKRVAELYMEGVALRGFQNQVFDATLTPHCSEQEVKARSCEVIALVRSQTAELHDLRSRLAAFGLGQEAGLNGVSPERNPYAGLAESWETARRDGANGEVKV